jgi:hypothetical protein
MKHSTSRHVEKLANDKQNLPIISACEMGRQCKEIVLKSHIGQKTCGVMTRPCCSVAAKLNDQGRMVRQARPELEFIPVLAAHVALGVQGCALLAGRGRGAPVHASS